MRASASRARAARLRPERDERGRGCSCTGEVADRERGVGLGGLLGLGGGTRGPQGVAAMARVRMPRLCRRGIPSRALPAAARRRETASRGAHRLRKARDPRSRASVVFQPRTSADARFPRSTPPRAQARRARVRPPTGQRRRIHRGASSENARSPRAPTRAPSRETSSENERKPSSRRFRAPSRMYPSRTLRSIERSSTPLHHRVSTGRAPGGA